jgi:hypothetical protein
MSRLTLFLRNGRRRRERVIETTTISNRVEYGGSLRACLVRERVSSVSVCKQSTDATSLSDYSPIAQTAAEDNDLQN